MDATHGRIDQCRLISTSLKEHREGLTPSGDSSRSQNLALLVVILARKSLDRVGALNLRISTFCMLVGKGKGD